MYRYNGLDHNSQQAEQSLNDCSLDMTSDKVESRYHVLPPQAKSFNGSAGKRLFTEALSTPFMNIYFKIGAQFKTQDQVNSSDLTSLVIVLNAFSIDPGIRWKSSVFRWFDEDSLRSIATRCNMNVNACRSNLIIELSHLFHVQAEFRFVGKHARTVSDFRNDIKTATSDDAASIILHYDRTKLKQAGGSHFSPVGGYNVLEDMVLILDVERYRYPPFWVGVTEIWKAMTLDEDSIIENYGYIMLNV